MRQILSNWYRIEEGDPLTTSKDGYVVLLVIREGENGGNTHFDIAACDEHGKWWHVIEGRPDLDNEFIGVIAYCGITVNRALFHLELADVIRKL